MQEQVWNVVENLIVAKVIMKFAMVNITVLSSQNSLVVAWVFIVIAVAGAVVTSLRYA